MINRSMVRLRFWFWRHAHRWAERIPGWYRQGWAGRLHGWVAWQRIRAWCAWEERIHPERIVQREQRMDLHKILSQVYTPEGVDIWLRWAGRQGWSLDEALDRAHSLADGAYA